MRPTSHDAGVLAGQSAPPGAGAPGRSRTEESAGSSASRPALPSHAGGWEAARGPSRSQAVATHRAAVLQAPRSIRIESHPLPRPGPAQVRVRLEGCGVCGSNLPVWEGRPWFTYPLEPGAPGHEGWGRIDAIGASVTGWREGERVALLSYHAFAESDLADATNLVRLPAALDGQPFPGEPLGCAMNVFRRADVRVGHNVAIIGIGFLGAVLTSLVARSGARVIAISRREAALAMARRMGACEAVPLEDHARILEEVKALTNGRGCDRVIEATGCQWPLDLGAELAAERGKLIIAGFHQDGLRQVNMQLWNWRGLDVINAHERDPAVYVEGMQAAVEAVTSGRLDPTPLYTDQFRIDELGKALDCLSERHGSFFKALVTYV